MSDNPLMTPAAAIPPPGGLAPINQLLRGPQTPPAPGTPANPLLNPRPGSVQPGVQQPQPAIPDAGGPRNPEGLENRVSTRIPTSKRMVLDPHERNDITVGRHAMIAQGFSPHHYAEEHHQISRASLADTEQKTAQHIREKYPFINTDGLTDAGVLERGIEHLHDNIVWMWNQVRNEPWRDKAAAWYWGANRMAGEFAQKYGVSKRQAAATIASLSPQKDWDENVSLAERVLDTHRNHQQTKVSQPMRDFMQKMVDARDPTRRDALDLVVNGGAHKKTGAEYRPIEVGQSYADLVHPEQKAMFIRALDEMHHADIGRHRGYDIISPTGERTRALNPQGTADAKIRWGSQDEITNAVRTLAADHLPTISRALGSMHKVRNFYNNIVSPDAAAFLPFHQQDLTADTHAINVGLLHPMGGTHPLVQSGLGGEGPASAISGSSGLYGLHADAYRRAAQTISQLEGRRYLPREVQSVTWEAIRQMFRKEHKRMVGGLPAHPVGQVAQGAAYAVRHGFMSPDMARQALLQAAVGRGLRIPSPRWHSGNAVMEEG